MGQLCWLECRWSFFVALQLFFMSLLPSLPWPLQIPRKAIPLLPTTLRKGEQTSLPWRTSGLQGPTQRTHWTLPRVMRKDWRTSGRPSPMTSISFRRPMHPRIIHLSRDPTTLWTNNIPSTYSRTLQNFWHWSDKIPSHWVLTKKLGKTIWWTCSGKDMERRSASRNVLSIYNAFPSFLLPELCRTLLKWTLNLNQEHKQPDADRSLGCKASKKRM